MTPPFIDFYYSGSNKRLALAALRKLYPRYSLKRRAAYLFNALNLHALHRAPKNLAQVRKVLSEVPSGATDGARAVLLHKIHQNGRIYSFEFDSCGVLVSVTKIALADTARRGVLREHDVLLQLADADSPFQVPRVLNFQDSKAACILTMSATAPELRPHDKNNGLPSQIYDAVASLRPVDAPAVLPCGSFAWFDASLRRVTNPVIRVVAQQITPDSLFDVCAAHRDLGSENIFSTAHIEPSAPGFAVIDWEFFTETAPAMTDRVGFWLGLHHRYFKRAIGSWNGHVAASRFLNTFSDTPGGVAAATLALLGLLYMGNDLAARLCGTTR